MNEDIKTHKVTKSKDWRRIFFYGVIVLALLAGMQLYQAYSIDPNFQTAPSPSSDIEIAIQKCEAGIMASSNNPSTVDIHRVTGFANNIDAAGTRRITQTFSAKNSFGLEKTFDAYCSLTSNGKFNINIEEQGK